MPCLRRNYSSRKSQTNLPTIRPPLLSTVLSTIWSPIHNSTNNSTPRPLSITQSVQLGTNNPQCVQKTTADFRTMRRPNWNRPTQPWWSLTLNPNYQIRIDLRLSRFSSWLISDSPQLDFWLEKQAAVNQTKIWLEKTESWLKFRRTEVLTGAVLRSPIWATFSPLSSKRQTCWEIVRNSKLRLPQLICQW